MRLTEALNYYNIEHTPTASYMRTHYSHFWPTPEDVKMREEYQRRLKKVNKSKKTKVMQEFE